MKTSEGQSSGGSGVTHSSVVDMVGERWSVTVWRWSPLDFYGC